MLEEHSLVKLFLTRKYYNKYIDKINLHVLPRELKDIVKSITSIYEESEDTDSINLKEVYAVYKANGSRTPAQCEVIKAILEQVNKVTDISDNVAEQVVKKYYEKECARQVADKALHILQQDSESTSFEQLKDFVSTLELPDEVEEESIFCPTSLNEVLKLKDSAGEFKFGNGLEQLNYRFSSPGRGNFIIVFAVPNVGKSTFVSQLSVGYLQQGLKLLYLCNEEPTHKIVLNHIRSCLNVTDNDIDHGVDVSKWEDIRHNLNAVTAHDMSILDIENLTMEYEPDVIIIDQLDNVLRKKGDDLHIVLEVLYQRARAIAAKHNCLVIAVSQASNDASGQLELKPNMMANSKIGKTGAADLILGLGMKDLTDQARGITAVKNKLNGVHECIYMNLDNERGRYIP